VAYENTRRERGICDPLSQQIGGGLQEVRINSMRGNCSPTREGSAVEQRSHSPLGRFKEKSTKIAGRGASAARTLQQSVTRAVLTRRCQEIQDSRQYPLQGRSLGKRAMLIIASEERENYWYRRQTGVSSPIGGKKGNLGRGPHPGTNCSEGEG